MHRTATSLAFFTICLAWNAQGTAQQVPRIEGVEVQPLVSATRRLVDALDYVGSPLSESDRNALAGAHGTPDPVATIQNVLDRHCLVFVHINHESRVKASAGPAPRELVQGGWRSFLVKVHNEAGVTARLNAHSPQAEPVFRGSSGSAEPEQSIPVVEIPLRFFDHAMYGKPPLTSELSGLSLEYRILELYSRDAGKREAVMSFDVGQGTQDLGFRGQLPILFDCLRAVPVTLEVLDFDGSPTTCSFLFKDSAQRVYPHPARRLAPDFFFHQQVYRHSGESVELPPGRYNVEWSRGPEYVPQSRVIEVPDAESHSESFELERWVHIAREGWRSGDHHVHAAGCAHYESPAQGVMPVDMMRHILGEDLNVGCVLSWGPCWYYQKQFFEGGVHPLSTDDYVMRYDVEVSGFPSSHAGHLTLLRLKEDDFPGTNRIDDWPSWDLPVLQWGKSQDAVVGFSHSGWGLRVSGDTLPIYEVPPYDGIGANEYIMDVVHDAVDFISTVDTPPLWELNIWYHTLNCGYRCRISGETDFPCIYGERVGLGRSYVKMDEGPLSFDVWASGIRDGRSYVSDGLSHLIDMKVSAGGHSVAVGEAGAGGAISQLDLAAPGGDVRVQARIAARLDQEPDDDIRSRPLHDQPYWHLERARIGDGRRVPVELIVNGQSVERIEIEADGSMTDVSFLTKLERSSWVALRIFPSSHTNPVFVHVGGKPIRASRRSAQWCLDSVEKCWESKSPAIRDEEKEEARRAYDVARDAYRRILGECEVD